MSQTGQSKSKAAPKSAASVKSVGIGDSVSPPHSPDLPRPLPEGFLTKSDPLFDCIVYVIYCPQHQNIATTNTLKSKCVWLPFVPLQEGVTWSVASHEGVSLLIGRNDPEMEAEEAERLAPKYAMSYLNILRIDVGKGRVLHRVTQLVRLEENAVYECCRNTERVFWLPLADVEQATTRITKLWGPELKTFTQLIAGQPASPESAFQLVDEMGSRLQYLQGSWQETLLNEFKMTESSVHEVFMEFIEHCYPSTYMSRESLRVYFLKYGLALEDERLLRLFNAFSQCLDQKRPHCVHFHEFITSLLCIEPNCPSKLEGRHRFIFRYYDTEKKGHLNEKDLCSLLKDSNQDLEDAKIEQEVKMHLQNRPSLDYDAFVSTFRSSPAVSEVCRVSQSLLKQISARRNSEYKERVRLNQDCEGVLKAKRVTKGTCWACRVQQYEFANHMVTIDTEGRSVEPNLIPVVKTSGQQANDHTLTRSRYSLEYVFAMGSTSSIFLDLIRDFHIKHQDNAVAGLMTRPQEWNILHKYLSFMCKEMSALLAQEKKLLRLNAPVIVTGDLNGNLDGLIQHLEKQLWQSFPVIPENLLFLGNYSSQFYNFGIETLIYLFALKLCSPNKVFLLRGLAELDATTGSALKEQCSAKYGAAKGQIIFSMVLQVFAKMPIAALLDDTVLCTHSGIPTDKRLVSSLLKLPKDMPNLQRDSRMALEMIRRTPKDTSQFDEADSQYGRTKTPQTASKSIPMETTAMKMTVMKQGKQKGIKSGDKIRKSIKSKPPKSVKSNFSKRKTKSIKSFKSQKTKPSSPPPSLLLKSFVVTKSSQSKKTSVFEQMIKMKNNEKKEIPQNPYHFEIDANNSVLCKGKPMFLTKYCKSSRKRIKSRPTASSTPPSPASGKLKTKSKSLKSKTVDRRRVQETMSRTIDEQEFVEFMAANDLSYLIRSGSLCKYGFAITYKHCLSIVSCCNIAQCGNQASVVLVEGSSIRTLRFSLSTHNDTTTTYKNTNNVNNIINTNNNA